MQPQLNLMLHCGSRAATRDQVDAVVTPEPSDTWYPVPHRDLIDQVGRTVQTGGLSIVQAAHGLSPDGLEYFGLLQVANGEAADDYGLVIGVRNSHNRRFSASLALGAGVFVCDNLSFSGEVTLARKHTRHIVRDLPGVVAQAVARLVDYRGHQDQRIEAYKGHELTGPQAHDAIINAIDCRALPPTKVPALLKHWRQPQHEDFRPRTAWSLFNAFTEVYKGSNAQQTLRRTQKLHGLLDSVCGLQAV
jgi:hypothetical protein